MLEVLGVDQWGEEAYIALVNGPPLSADEGMAPLDAAPVGRP